ncbi:MAG: hypothetical protein ABEJ95_04205 [Candidatus Nanohalobium sp.]
MAPECDKCGEDLFVNPVERPDVDWVRVVCSECGNVTDVSMIRLSATVKNRE